MTSVGLGVALGAAATIGARRVLRDADQRERLRRQVRIWKLTARRGSHFAVVKVRGVGRDEARRAELEEQFAIRTAEDVAAELGNMKGAIMKLGQMVSFIAEGLPPEARAALATLQQDVPPMAPSLAESVVREQLGDDPERLFLDWSPVPVAAASIGQVHRAVLHDGREVAVKVQYPGVGSAIKHDLDNAELLYGMFSAVALKGLDVKALVDELRARMYDELDYTLEAGCQTEFWERYRDHPFIRIPKVVPELSSEKVLTTEWVDGIGWNEFEQEATPQQRQRAAEVVFRFAQGSVHEHRVFNGDPHPGNYRFHDDGSVTFFDFGLVKRWSADEFEQLIPILDLVMDQQVPEMVVAMEEVGFIRRDHGLDAPHVFACVSAPYRAYMVDEFTFTPEYTTEALQNVMDLQGPYADVIRNINMPPSFVILDRVVWGVSALLGRLEARNRWRGILDEYRHGGAPATELGELELAWKRDRGFR
ncbi:MAG: AarF/ABC1/UbiB kinase family protein [Acidimicrobiales bacterium]|nr:AarF/ABC1/UbiB kinase family protein [Acidimicrobiales bacterium]